MSEHVASARLDAAPSPPDGDATPVCLSCGQDMQYVRTIKNLGILPEIVIFRCPACHTMIAVQPLGLGRSVGSKD